MSVTRTTQSRYLVWAVDNKVIYPNMNALKLQWKSYMFLTFCLMKDENLPPGGGRRLSGLSYIFIVWLRVRESDWGLFLLYKAELA